MKLLFVGDVMLGRLVNQALKARTPEYPWGNTLDVFRSADVRFCNLECSLSIGAYAGRPRQRRSISARTPETWKS